MKEYSSGKAGGLIGSLKELLFYTCIETSELKLNVVVDVYNPSTGGIEAGRAEVQGHPQLYKGFEASLDYKNTI